VTVPALVDIIEELVDTRDFAPYHAVNRHLRAVHTVQAQAEALERCYASVTRTSDKGSARFPTRIRR
jgi:hypothetical protein